MTNNHIILLQETLLPIELHDYFTGITPNFDYFAVLSVSSNNANFLGRPKGGLCIMWRKILHKSNCKSWRIGNGVRQCGILSGMLFASYINDVLNTICNLNVGCKLLHYRTNILGYADDSSVKD